MTDFLVQELVEARKRNCAKKALNQEEKNPARFQLETCNPAWLGSKPLQLGLVQLRKFQLKLITTI